MRLDNRERRIVVRATEGAELDIWARNAHEREQKEYGATEQEQAAPQVVAKLESQNLGKHQAAFAALPFCASSVEKYTSSRSGS